MVALADPWGLACAVELPQIPFLSLEIKASPDAITDVATALPMCWSLSSFPGSTKFELTMRNLFLPFCKIHPCRVGRFPWDFVLLLSLVLAMSTHSSHSHHISTLIFLECFLLSIPLHLCLVLVPQLSCCYLISPTSHKRWDCCFWSSPLNQELPPGLHLTTSFCCQSKLLV